jgi:uncharacterized paraquat-inducible protein A
MTSFDMYWFLKLDNICNFFSGVVFTSIVAIAVVAIVYGFISMDSYGEDENRTNFRKVVKKHSRWFIPLFVVSVLGSIFVPSTKQAAVIYLVPKIINNEKIQQTTNDGLNILQLKVHEYMVELEKNSKNEK